MDDYGTASPSLVQQSLELIWDSLQARVRWSWNPLCATPAGSAGLRPGWANGVDVFDRKRVEWPQFMPILMRKMISDEIYWDFGVPCFKTNPDLSWSFSREKTRFVNQAGLSQSSNDVFNPSQTADKWCTQFEQITHKVVDITTSMSIYNMEVS